jgi:hypothetical protein
MGSVYAAQAAPLAWPSFGNATTYTLLWFMMKKESTCLLIFILFSYADGLFLIKRRVQFNPCLTDFFQCVLCISFYAVSSISLFLLR